MSQYGRFLVTMLVLDALGYALVVVLVPSNSIAQLAALVPVLLVAPLVARRLVYGEWVSRPDVSDEEENDSEESH
ncbi:hypothetical protein SAMN04487950_2990 [Halogranum rubrum]|uniref:Uncharacterized protein n=2 Tax=Halogranum rubrum TaxID=553466 RepID=A0A1I4G1T3_9EURY|nr:MULTISPECIES: hypothetical protein [Halogranum]EJN59523.1 hypothetical protein HSB1_16810 [Halogranum salarium B-1]SFL23984.1 hypothetical protein SAMN04487950_2990 [Halogranum rubrum]